MCQRRNGRIVCVSYGNCKMTSGEIERKQTTYSRDEFRSDSINFDFGPLIGRSETNRSFVMWSWNHAIITDWLVFLRWQTPAFRYRSFPLPVWMSSIFSRSCMGSSLQIDSFLDEICQVGLIYQNKRIGNSTIFWAKDEDKLLNTLACQLRRAIYILFISEY